MTAKFATVCYGRLLGWFSLLDFSFGSLVTVRYIIKQCAYRILINLQWNPSELHELQYYDLNIIFLYFFLLSIFFFFECRILGYWNFENHNWSLSILMSILHLFFLLCRNIWLDIFFFFLNMWICLWCGVVLFCLNPFLILDNTIFSFF